MNKIEKVCKVHRLTKKNGKCLICEQEKFIKRTKRMLEYSTFGAYGQYSHNVDQVKDSLKNN